MVKHDQRSDYTSAKDHDKQGRHDRLLQERYDDPYRSDSKLKQPAICRQCKAVYVKGHWTLKQLTADEMALAQQVMCPACQRIHDNKAAAYLTISGDFMLDHQDEINGLINHRCEQEHKLHPLKRIMTVEERPDSQVYSFTDAHLARDIGVALYKAYAGELDCRYSKRTSILRVRWSRSNNH
ncbi:MAG: ATPase [Proteobacteria bacterium]|nr:ATPase [Pseudomonadota bacterium]